MLEFALTDVLVRTIREEARVLPGEVVQPPGDADVEKRRHSQENAAEPIEVEPDAAVDETGHHGDGERVEDHRVPDRLQGLGEPAGPGTSRIQRSTQRGIPLRWRASYGRG